MQNGLGRGFAAECFAPTLNENSPQAGKVRPLLPLLLPQLAVEKPMPGAAAGAVRGTLVVAVGDTAPLGRLKMGLLHVLRHAPAAPEVRPRGEHLRDGMLLALPQESVRRPRLLGELGRTVEDGLDLLIDKPDWGEPSGHLSRAEAAAPGSLRRTSRR